MESNGDFQIPHETVSALLGDLIDDGSHTFHLLATDSVGNSSVIASVSFTYDSTPPPLDFDLAPESDSPPIEVRNFGRERHHVRDSRVPTERVLS